MANGPFILGGDADLPPRRLTAHLFAPIKISRGQFVDLLAPFRHSVHIRRHAASVMISRVQLVAALFGVLVPVFSVLDWAVLPWPQWALMTALRIASGAIFLLLAWPWRFEKTRLRADLMLLVLLLVPPTFYLVSIRILADLPADSTVSLVVKLYALMPNVVLAGIAVFPLTALEVLVFSAPAFVLALVGYVLSGEPLSLLEHGPELWLMVLVMGVAMFSGMSQLHYMSALVNRAMFDPLTGAYTRHSGSETLDLLFRLSVLQDAPFAVAFFDLDRFKAINDGYGHDAGDRALIAFAESLRRNLRLGDVLVRWGGEEFVAILNNTTGEGARVLVERLRAHGYGLRPDGAPLTASIGVAERIADQASDWPELVERADQRMYRAKHSGRDRAVLPGDAELPFAA
jgi:diguanylate cyclase (GGDEF)-like protein